VLSLVGRTSAAVYGLALATVMAIAKPCCQGVTWQQRGANFIDDSFVFLLALAGTLRQTHRIGEHIGRHGCTAEFSVSQTDSIDIQIKSMDTTQPRESTYF
jgi:hypothetical protein